MGSQCAILGPHGTLTESAARAVAADSELRPVSTLPAALELIDRGEVSAAVMALGGSVEGTACVAFEDIAHAGDYMITAEVRLPVSLALLTTPGTALGDVTHVVTHPHAHAACAQWLGEHLPGRGYVSAGSATRAAASLQAGSLPEEHTFAALCAPAAAARFELDIAVAGIVAQPARHARFVSISARDTPPPATGNDITALVVHQPTEGPGTLRAMLEVFSKHALNVVRIASRADPRTPGRYAFALEVQGHIADDAMGEALLTLRSGAHMVDFLGSYPAYPVHYAPPAQHAPDRVLTDDRLWLAELRGTTPDFATRTPPPQVQ